MQFSNILIEAVRYDVIYSYSKHEYKTSAMHQSHKVLLFISKQHFNQLLGKCHGVCVLKTEYERNTANNALCYQNNYHTTKFGFCTF